RETVARLEEAQRNLEQLEARRDEERAREREGLQAELSSLKSYANCSAEDADKLVAMASEIRRLSEQDSRARNTVLERRASIAGVVLLGLRLQLVVWISLVASGGAVLGTGIWLLRTGARLRESDREAALNRLSDAQRRLNQLRVQRVESERALNETSRALGYRDSIELVRDWNEYVRLSEESTPVMRAQE